MEGSKKLFIAKIKMNTCTRLEELEEAGEMAICGVFGERAIDRLKGS